MRERAEEHIQIDPSRNWTSSAMLNQKPAQSWAGVHPLPVAAPDAARTNTAIPASSTSQRSQMDHEHGRINHLSALHEIGDFEHGGLPRVLFVPREKLVVQRLLHGGLLLLQIPRLGG